MEVHTRDLDLDCNESSEYLAGWLHKEWQYWFVQRLMAKEPKVA